MNKMDEKILVVDRNHIFENESLTFQGVMRNYKSVSYIMDKFNKYFEVRRGDAEVNQSWKQPIPYAIIKRGDEVFLYKRLKAGGEKRLHDQLSIGVGGHMNSMKESYNWDDILMTNLYKELGEELDIKSSCYPEPEIVGIINDDENPVGAVHIGILAILELPADAEVIVRETDQLEGHWVRTQDLTKSPLFESLESWSQMAVRVL